MTYNDKQKIPKQKEFQQYQSSFEAENDNLCRQTLAYSDNEM